MSDFEVGRVMDTVREKRAARAIALRDKGLKLCEIAERMNVAVSTVDAWIKDPDGSQLRMRKDSYRGRCEECGEPTDGSRGPGQAPRVCARCLKWTDEQIVEAIRRWADEHGGVPPTTSDWHLAPTDKSFPCSTIVIRRMGWNNALLMAGFELRRDCRPETQAEIEHRIANGETRREVAERFGVSPNAIRQRLAYRGLNVRQLRRAA